MYIKAWRNKRNFADSTKPCCGRGREGPCFGVWAVCARDVEVRMTDVLESVGMTAFAALFAALSGTKKKAGERHWRFSRQCLFTAARSASCRKGLRVLEIDAFFEVPRTV